MKQKSQNLMYSTQWDIFSVQSLRSIPNKVGAELAEFTVWMRKSWEEGLGWGLKRSSSCTGKWGRVQSLSSSTTGNLDLHREQDERFEG